MPGITNSRNRNNVDLADPAAVRKRIRATSPRALMKAVLAAFDQLGGVGWLVRQAERDPRGFLQLLARVLPRDVHLELDARAVIDDLIQLRRQRRAELGGGGGRGRALPGGGPAVAAPARVESLPAAVPMDARPGDGAGLASTVSTSPRGHENGPTIAQEASSAAVPAPGRPDGGGGGGLEGGPAARIEAGPAGGGQAGLDGTGRIDSQAPPTDRPD